MQVKFETSSKLLENPSHMETLVLSNLACSWKQLSVLTQHFNMSDSHYPTVRDKNDVYNELQSVVSFGTQGLKLLGWSPIDNSDDEFTVPLDNDEVGRDDNEPASANVEKLNLKEYPQPIPGFQTIRSLVYHYGVVEYNIENIPHVKIQNISVQNSTIPGVLQNYLWSELRYLELEITHLNLTHILLLNMSAPSLT